MLVIGTRLSLLLIVLGLTTRAGLAQNADWTRHGEYLARAADCVACHTGNRSKPFAGGNTIETPFGVIYGTNSTPDKETGIGTWSDEDFLRAVREGTAPGGVPLYPAMPYASFAKLNRDD